MPSREGRVRINLQEVSSSVGKFSAELDLVDSCSSKRAANNHFSSRSAPRNLPPNQPNLVGLANFYEFPGPVRQQNRGLLRPFTTEALGATSRKDRKGNTCSPPCACSFQHLVCSNFRAKFRSSLVIKAHSTAR